MNVKLLIVLTMILCAFCVLPVNAESSWIISKSPNEENLGFNPIEQTLSITMLYDDYVNVEQSALIIYRDNQQDHILSGLFDECITNSYFESNGKRYRQITVSLQPLVNYGLNNDGGSFLITARFWLYDDPYVSDITAWTFTTGEMPISDYDIDIDLHEQTLELGEINSLEQTFEIGSSSNRVVRSYLTYSATSCDIEDLQRNYIKVKFNKNFLDDSEIYLSGYALNQTAESEFTTYVRFNFTYIPISNLQAFIQTFDYQSGNMVSGVNLSVYEVIDNGDSLSLGNMVYSSISAESQTILMLKNNTDYFVKNELGGYLSVKNTEYPLLNNEVGYLWSPSIVNPLILYYSKLDPTAQYNVGFIVQDTSNNGLSGVSVTIDNSVTKITNSIGGVTFNNVSSGTHSFTFVKNGYQSAQITKNIQMQYATFTQTLFADNQIIQPTTAPTAYPTVKPTTQPTISPVEQPKNIADSVKYGLAKVFGVTSLDSINLVFALIIILFPAVVGGVITNQSLAFVAGGMIGFVVALGLGLIPIWVFFAMVMFTVIYLILTTGNNF